MSAELVELGDVVKVDRTAATEEACLKLPFVGLEHIEKDTGAFVSGYRPVPESLLATKFRFTPQHVLYGKLRPNLNKVLIPRFDGVCTTEILPLLPKNGAIDTTYLYFLLQSPRFVAWATHSVSGANLPRLDPKTLEEFSFYLPPTRSQKIFSDALLRAQTLRRMRRYELQMCDELLPAMFLAFFGDPAANPHGFPVAELGDFLSFVTSGSRGWAEYYAAEGSRFIRSLDVRMNLISDDDAVFVNPPSSAEADRTRVKTGDVLLTITGSQIGRVAPATDRLNGAFISQHVAILRLKPGLLPIFLSMFLSLDAGGQREIARVQYGQTKPGLNLQQIREFRMPLPPLSFQKEIVGVIGRNQHLHATYVEALRQADHLFHTLLHRAFG
jgi:type I restriction enzyme S subunit